MLARVQSYLLTGIDALPCEVEVDVDETDAKDRSVRHWPAADEGKRGACERRGSPTPRTSSPGAHPRQPCPGRRAQGRTGVRPCGGARTADIEGRHQHPFGWTQAGRPHPLWHARVRDARPRSSEPARVRSSGRPLRPPPVPHRRRARPRWPSPPGQGCHCPRRTRQGPRRQGRHRPRGQRRRSLRRRGDRGLRCPHTQRSRGPGERPHRSPPTPHARRQRHAPQRPGPHRLLRGAGAGGR